jgi:hypothetical protein
MIMKKLQGSPTPLAPIYRLIEKTKMPLGPNTMKTAK